MEISILHPQEFNNHDPVIFLNQNSITRPSFSHGKSTEAQSKNGSIQTSGSKTDTKATFRVESKISPSNKHVKRVVWGGERQRDGERPEESQ